jgi:hypothetical protein
MTYGEMPYDHLYGLDEQEDRWEAQYADYLDQQMEAQYHAELEAQHQASLEMQEEEIIQDAFQTIEEEEIRDPHALLHCPMIQPNDARAATVGEFLASLLSALWLEGEGFSGKRPLGNSDWQWQVYMSMVAGGLAEGIINKWGDEDISDEGAANELILQAIRLAYNHE